MKAVILSGKSIHIEDIPVPVPGNGEALIEVIKAGICNTDLELVKGYMDFVGILGHEFVGRVVEAPDREWVGKRVAGEISLPCGSCDLCSENRSNHCPTRQVLGIHQKDGVFAEYVTLPVKNLHALPSMVSDREAVFVEPLAAALAIFDQIQVGRKDEVLVLGDGKLGLLVALVMKTRSPHIYCSGHHRRKLALLQERGILTTQNAREWERKFDLVIEVTGTSEGIIEAFCFVKPRGAIIAKSTFYGMAEIDYSALVVNEIRLIGSRCGSFEKAIEFLKDDSVGLEEMVDAEFPLTDTERAFEKARAPGVIKVLITP